VQRYDFKRISFKGITARLFDICQVQIGPNFEQAALDYLAKIADGGMRDAISLLDKCLSYNENLTVRSVTEALGVIDYEFLFDLVDDILGGNEQQAVKKLERIYREGKDLKQFLKNFVSLLLDIRKYNILGAGSSSYLQVPDLYYQIEYYDKKDIDIRQLLPKAVNLQNLIKYENNPKMLIEISMLAWCEMFEGE